MFRLVVGLGNPGSRYAKTRHNVGFWFVDSLARDVGADWVVQSRFSGVLASSSMAGEKLFMLKPETFMNKSGDAVGKVARYYNIEPQEILVAHDELDFDVGVVRLKKGGGHAGHNGLRDIVAHLGSKDFYRLRVGIGRPQAERKNVADYVLSEPSKMHRQAIDSSLDLVLMNIALMFSGQIDRFMNQIH